MSTIEKGLVFFLLCAFLVLGIVTGVNHERGMWRKATIEAGSGSFNPTTGIFELHKIDKK